MNSSSSTYHQKCGHMFFLKHSVDETDYCNCYCSLLTNEIVDY